MGQAIWQPALAAPWSFCQTLTSDEAVIRRVAAGVVLCYLLLQWFTAVVLWSELRCA